MPLRVTYNQALPNLKGILTKHWHMLQVNQSFIKTYSTLFIIVFRKETRLKQAIGINTIHNKGKFIKAKNSYYTGKCVPNSRQCLCYLQLVLTTTFKSNLKNKTIKIFRRANCKTSFVIYPLECYIYNIQYVGKSETAFNIRL